MNYSNIIQWVIQQSHGWQNAALTTAGPPFIRRFDRDIDTNTRR